MNSGYLDGFPNVAWTILTTGVDPIAVTFAADGSVYVGGATNGARIYDGKLVTGTTDAFLTRFQADGTRVWSTLLGGAFTQATTSIVTAPDNSIYIAGYFLSPTFEGFQNSGQRDAYLAKYEPDGTQEWVRVLGGTQDDEPFSLAVGADGAIYVGGVTKSPTFDGLVKPFSAIPLGVSFLTKYEPDGSKAWTLLESYRTSLNKIATSADGSIYAVGSYVDLSVGQGGGYLSRYLSDGTKAWIKTFVNQSSVSTTPTAITIGRDGGIYAVGVQHDGSNGHEDIFVTKYSESGDELWTKIVTFTTPDAQNYGTKISGLSFGVDGSIYLGGSTAVDRNLDGVIDSRDNVLFIGKLEPGASSLTSETFTVNGGRDVSFGLDNSTYAVGIANGDIYTGSVTKLVFDPTYAITATMISVNEGGSVTFNVTTTNVASGTQLNFTLGGSGLTTGDVVDGQLSGTATVGADYKASFTVNLTADQLTEGTETLTAIVHGQSASVTVNDTSIASPLELRPVTFRNGVVTFELWLKPGVIVEAGDLVLSNLTTQGSFKAGSIVAASGITAAENLQAGSTAISFFGTGPVGGVSATKLMSFGFDALPGVRQFEAGVSVASLTFEGQTEGLDVTLPPPASLTDFVDLTGIAYHWKSHALLSGVTVSAQGGAGPAEGSQAPIQLKYLTWSAAGEATVEVWAQATASSQNVGFELDLGAATQAQFTQDATLAGWTVAGNAQTTGYALAAFTADSTTALAAGSHKLGTLSFSLGVAQQAQIGLVTGEVDTVASTPYAVNLARTVSDTAGCYTLTELDPGAYALQARRATSDTGNAITSADALAALRIAVGLNPNAQINGVQGKLSPYQIIAADVVGVDGKVTSADALGILRMAVKLPTAPVNEWLFVEETRDFWNEAANNGQGAFTLSRTTASWDKTIAATAQENQAVNLVGVLKGDVTGSWAAPAGSHDLDVISPLYFQNLSTLIGAPLDQWGIV